RRDHDPYGALDLWERYRAAARRSRQPGDATRPSRARDAGIDFKALDAGPALPRIDQVRSMLPSLGSVTVLSYAQLRDGLAVWAFDDRGIEAKWVPVPPETLERRALAFAQQCSDPSSDLAHLRADATELYQWLIGPVEDRLTPGRTLVIEPDGAVSNIPLQALLDPSGRYLGARQALVVSPAAYDVRRPAAPEFSSTLGALVVGAPAVPGEMAEEFAPLPDAEQEARSVAARFDHTTLLTGRQATLQAIQPQFAKAAVFHFAGHALAGASRSGLLLAPSIGDADESGEILDPARLQPRDLRLCKLAVLSTCSAASEETTFEAPENLAEEFLRAGVPHVVASRWSVDSSVTEALMEAFYSDLLAGGSVPRALQAAQAGILQRPETRHPYFWAAFSAFGRS
ncbi:MAG TPA: CHAT domain-containing protein, partial [Terriglobia bacterium]|nr:CHAT domain-containing protein [Terriglobia bacterium]